MDRREWQLRFRRAWVQRTVWHTSKDYQGLDYSRENVWFELVGNTMEFTGTEFKTEKRQNLYWFGAPYRKEVTVNDEMGTYQSSWFQMEEGRITKTGLKYPGTAWFDEDTLSELKEGLDLMKGSMMTWPLRN